jgi:putative ABC transport system ATP-binding protein
VALLSFEHVSKRYWRGAHELVVLDDVSLELEAGEFAAVWGRRGAGKTTLLRIAAGLERPDAGRVQFDGHDLGALSRAGLADVWRQRIALVESDPPLIDRLPIRDYVAMPLLAECSPREMHRRADQALRKVGIADCASGSWEELSNGERALVAVAHAIVRRPSLLLADDPTARLDAVEGDELTALLESAAREAGLAVLMTTPDVPQMRQSHRFMSLSGGRLTDPGAGPLGGVVELGRKRPRPDDSA